MANQELRVGSRWKWTTPYGHPVPFTYVAQGRIRYDDDEPVHSWAVSPGRIADGATPLPAPAAEQPLCTRCDKAEVAAGCMCPKCGFVAPAAERPAARAWIPPVGCTCTPFEQEELCPHHGRTPVPPPPRCAPGCTPAQPCRGVTCPEHREEMTGYNMVMDDKRSLCGAPDPNSAAAGCMEVVGHDGPCSFYDPPAREPRIGALSWSHATACGGLSTRRGQ